MSFVPGKKFLRPTLKSISNMKHFDCRIPFVPQSITSFSILPSAFHPADCAPVVFQRRFIQILWALKCTFICRHHASVFVSVSPVHHLSYSKLSALQQYHSLSFIPAAVWLSISNLEHSSSLVRRLHFSFASSLPVRRWT